MRSDGCAPLERITVVGCVVLWPLRRNCQTAAATLLIGRCAGRSVKAGIRNHLDEPWSMSSGSIRLSSLLSGRGLIETNPGLIPSQCALRGHRGSIIQIGKIVSVR